MFTADLSWTTEPHTEKVGERKERKARERGKEKERSTSSAAQSISSVKSSKASVSEDREVWWPASLRKAKSFIPTTKVRPETPRSKITPSFGSRFFQQNLEIDTSDTVRDPTLQPAWTYSTTLSPTLPSGASLEPPEHEVPELEGDMSSRGTDSGGSRSSHERRFGWPRSPARVKVIEEAHEVQPLSPHSYVAHTARLNSESPRSEDTVSRSSPSSHTKKKKLYSVRIEGCLDLEALKLRDQVLRDQHPEEFGPLAEELGPTYASGLTDQDLMAWRPSSASEIGHLSSQESKSEMMFPAASVEGTAAPESGTAELTRFQRFIRRMESAGPKIILERVKEEWTNPVDIEAGEEMLLEKQLWVLTAFQLENLGRYSRFPKSNTGKILELYGNLAEVYQLSAMYPRHKVHYLTTRPRRASPLPGNVSYLMVPEPGMIPFPYPDCSFSHIRASSLPSLVPSSKLPDIFRECYRILAPGGMLEIRIMDAAPLRRTAGPKMKMWIEDRLSDNLERSFRCSKPCTLVPGWISDAGFDLPASVPSEREENVKLRCAFDPSVSDVNRELSTIVGRELWKDLWGNFVQDVPGQPRWWWDDVEVVKECLEKETVFECGAIFAFKN